MFGKGKRQTKQLEALANAPVGAPTVIAGRRGFIKGTVIFTEAGDTWIEHLIQDQQGESLWVSIENFDKTVATLWRALSPGSINGGPEDKKISHDGASFKRSEDGTANYSSKGDLDLFETGSVDYVDFECPDGRRLGFERYGEGGGGRRTLTSAATCPRCGAALHTDVTGRCSSCGSDLKTTEGNWEAWEVAIGLDVSDDAHLQ